MQVGTNWGGDYSRFSFDETKRYFYMLKEQGKPVLDDEFNLHQEIILTLMRRWIIDRIGDGSPNNGFLIVGTSAANDFTITGGGGTADNAGHLYINGYLVILPSNTTYLTQPITQSALTTPGGARVDEVYIDAWLDEIDGVEDTNIIDPTLGTETSRRLKLQWEIKVVEGGTTPVPFNDGNNIFHNTFHVATLNRTAQAAIDAGMVVDVRALLKWPEDNIDYVLSQESITKDKADNTQLHAAINQMIMNASSSGNVIITSATFEASVTNGEAVLWDGINSQFDEATADGTANNLAVGIADVTNSQVFCFGETGAVLSGLTPGAKQHLHGTTAGALTETAPADIVKMGVAKSATVMFVDIDHQQASPSATTVGEGVIELATQAEVNAGTDAVRAITPATLAGATAGPSVPSGSKTTWIQNAAPTGWTFVAENNDKMFINSATVTDGGVAVSGSTWTIAGMSAGVTGGHTLSIAEMPIHGHSFTAVLTAPLTGFLDNTNNTAAPASAGNTGSTGGGGSHTHPGSTITHNGTWRPLAVNVITCTKN